MKYDGYNDYAVQTRVTKAMRHNIDNAKIRLSFDKLIDRVQYRIADGRVYTERRAVGITLIDDEGKEHNYFRASDGSACDSIKVAILESDLVASEAKMRDEAEQTEAETLLGKLPSILDELKGKLIEASPCEVVDSGLTGVLSLIYGYSRRFIDKI